MVFNCSVLFGAIFESHIYKYLLVNCIPNKIEIHNICKVLHSTYCEIQGVYKQNMGINA